VSRIIPQKSRRTQSTNLSIAEENRLRLAAVVGNDSKRLNSQMLKDRERIENDPEKLKLIGEDHRTPKELTMELSLKEKTILKNFKSLVDRIENGEPASQMKLPDSPAGRSCEVLSSRPDLRPQPTSPELPVPTLPNAGLEVFPDEDLIKLAQKYGVMYEPYNRQAVLSALTALDAK